MPRCDVGMEEPNHIITGQEAGGISAAECRLILHISVTDENPSAIAGIVCASKQVLFDPFPIEQRQTHKLKG